MSRLGLAGLAERRRAYNLNLYKLLSELLICMSIAVLRTVLRFAFATHFITIAT